ncbi:MAG: hypothetical protein JWM82_544 [Myxococcales bacterium]|nr:hypothetical protein [Myxococcales bacterium]
MSLRAALRHLDRGEWEQAHELVRKDETPLFCWAHGIAHLHEGDLDNARYWLGRAGRRFTEDKDEELAALMAAAGAA